MFLNCSTCFERHTAHHQDLKNCNFTLWFYIRLWLPAAVSHDSCWQPQTYVKPEAAITVFELLMVSGALKHVERLNIGIINSTTWSHLVGYFYMICVMMHGSMKIKSMGVICIVLELRQTMETSR